MDLAHFGLTRRPFRSTPDTDAYFNASSHESALSAIRAAYSARDGLTLLDGDPGTGKTLVAMKFLEGLAAEVPRVLIPAARLSRSTELFQAILFDLGADYRGLTEQELRLSVTEQLLSHLVEGQPTVIVLDEAQHLGAEALEEIRLLGNLETRSTKATFILLVAQPQLRERLAKPDLVAVAQRIAVRCHLDPMSAEESTRFLQNQLRAAGARAEMLLSEEAIALLAANCKGLPRLLNQAASLAMSLAAAVRADHVDVEAALEALAQLGLTTEIVDDPAVIPHPARRGKRRGPKRKSA